MTNWAIQLAEHWKKCEDIVHAFGLVLYTDSHPHVKKVVSDNDYWAALDEISGPKWPVFSIKPRQGRFDLPDLPPGYMGMMVPVWKEPSENKAILEAFGLQSTEGLPNLIVFCLGENNQVLHHQISLKHETVEEAYSSLKSAIEAATTAVNDILPENKKNVDGVYAALDLTIASHKRWQMVKQGWEVFQFLKKLKP